MVTLSVAVGRADESAIDGTPIQRLSWLDSIGSPELEMAEPGLVPTVGNEGLI
jgi:hypothetical protein